MSSVDTVCPVCWESVHGDEPVGVISPCGHVMHQSCYRDCQKRGDNELQLPSNCLICNQPTKSFVDLFIRLPAVSVPNHKENAAQLEHEFNRVCRKTQLALEKEIARRDFEQTWLQEERQLSRAAREKTEQGHQQKIREMQRQLKELKKEYQRKMNHMDERRRRKEQQEEGGNSSSSDDPTREGQRLLFDSFNSVFPEQSEEQQDQDDSSAQEVPAVENMISDNTNGEDFLSSTPTPHEQVGMRNEENDQLINETEEMQCQIAEDTKSSEIVPPMASAPATNTNTATASVMTPTSSYIVEEDSRQLLVGVVSPETTPYRQYSLPDVALSNCRHGQSKTDPKDAANKNRNTISGNQDGSAGCNAGTFSTAHQVIGDHNNQANNSLMENNQEFGLRTRQISPVTTSIPATARRLASLSTARGSAARSRSTVPKDTIFHPEEGVLNQPTNGAIAAASPTRGRRCVLRDDIFYPPATNNIISSSAPTVASSQTISSTANNGSGFAEAISEQEEDKKQPAVNNATASEEQEADGNESNDSFNECTEECRSPDKVMTAYWNDDSEREQSKSHSSFQFDESETSLSVADYELQRLQADSAFYQHQAELVEWERHQTEFELEQDELALRQRELRIRMERSRLEQSFTFIQRRVRESKREARDRQKLSALEEKYSKYKLARRREEERYEQELNLLQQDELHIQEREHREVERQEREKARLKKEVNELLKVESRLEQEKELARQMEEQSSNSQCNETCVVCFESLVNDESELGVAVPCGHAFHCS